MVEKLLHGTVFTEVQSFAALVCGPSRVGITWELAGSAEYAALPWTN